MLILSIFLIVISVILSCFALYKLKNINKINKSIEEENQQLTITLNKLKQEASQARNDLELLNHDVLNASTKLAEIHQETETVINNKEALSKKAFENYCLILEKEYQELTKEYQGYQENLEASYSNKQLELLEEINKTQKDLDQIKATRTAAIQAQLREKEIENNISFYCLQLSDSDKADIIKIEALKPSLSKPRILSMLIWQTWFQKPLKSLTAQVLKTEDKTGIYKITNIQTKECYIGQAVSIKDRWVEHVKCGLGIDTPAGNKLYKSMQEYGIWNFSFEMLEECPRELLNEKEKYYINLYSSYDYGFNSNRGNG